MKSTFNFFMMRSNRSVGFVWSHIVSKYFAFGRLFNLGFKYFERTVITLDPKILSVRAKTRPLASALANLEPHNKSLVGTCATAGF